MTYTEAEIQLAEVAQVIKRNREQLAGAKLAMSQRATNLSAIPTAYAELITFINGLTPGDAQNDVLQAKLGNYTTEFQALRTQAQSAATDLEAYDEF